MHEGTLAPLRDRLEVQSMLCRKLFERSFRSLQRCSNRVRGRGAAVKNLSHNASRYAERVEAIEG
jgi:hypothetical protein